MTESPKLGLTLTPASDNTKTFSNFRTELAGDSPTSNMMILDEAVGGHVEAQIASEDGAHGFRYNANDETFEVYNSSTGEWEEVSSASGGGGLALGAVTDIATLTANGKVYLQWTDPENIVLEGATLAEWAGTLLVRKAGSAPTKRNDGTIVLDSTTKNAYSSSYLCDSGLTNDVVYYYKFFPYTTTGVYTDSALGLVNATPDMVDVGNVTGVAITAAGNGKLSIKWTDPATTVVSDGVTLATWASTKVVYKTGSYPTTPEDGTLAINSTTRNAYSTTGLSVSGLINGTTYYVAFFPCSTDGAVNTDAENRGSGAPSRIVIANVPSQSGTLTYSGSDQTPVWSNYDNTQMTIGGTTSGTNAGSYNATFTPNDDYMWSDSTTAAKTVAWSIGKAAGSLSLSPTSITLNSSSPNGTITVTRAGNGTITASSSDTSVATVSVSGTIVTVSNVNQKTGSATITVSVAAGTNHTAPANKTCAVTAQFMPVKTTLEATSWADISTVSAASEGANYWAVGDRKSVLVNGTVGTQAVNATYWVYILGFNHKGATGIDFGTFKSAQTSGTDLCLTDANYNATSTAGGLWFNMNHSGNTNAGGWKGCDLRYNVLGSTNTNDGNATTTTATSPVANTLMAALPSALRAVMKPMTIYTDNTGGGSDTASYVTTTVDYLPLLAEFEIFGTRSYANSAEKNYQAQYAYYSAGNAKIKYRHTATTAAAPWWERSPRASDSTGFCFVNTNGGANRNSACNSLGLAPAFRV